MSAVQSHTDDIRSNTINKLSDKDASLLVNECVLLGKRFLTFLKHHSACVSAWVQQPKTRACLDLESDGVMILLNVKNHLSDTLSYPRRWIFSNTPVSNSNVALSYTVQSQYSGFICASSPLCVVQSFGNVSAWHLSLTQLFYWLL